MMVQGKCASIEGQLDARIKAGITDVEIQLFKNDSTRQVIDLFTRKDVTVNTVHPILESEDLVSSVCLDTLDNLDVRQYFTQACKIGNEIAKHQGREVGIILHNTFTAEQFLLHPSVLEKAVQVLRMHKNQFEHIYFMIENVTPICKGMALDNGCLPEHMKGVIDLFKQYGIDLYVCLDLCHNKMTQQQYEGLWDCIPSLRDDISKTLSSLTFKSWFELFGSDIRSIHVSRCNNDGVRKEDHGAPLTSADRITMLNLFETCRLYAPDVLWTIEVRDDDYYNPVNQIRSYNICNEIILQDWRVVT